MRERSSPAARFVYVMTRIDADVEPVVADRAHEALDEHARLSGSGSRRDEDEALRVDRRLLLGVHARVTRHTGQRSHHDGQEPLRGSCRTSPARIRCASERASPRAVSSRDQNSSSSR